jgi:HAD superfamily hydrolase (TIGR01459 family)
MSESPRILAGLHEIAPGHDALVCDVWGVIHNGTSVHADAVEALAKFRAGFGPVVLLSNAPRPVSAILEQFAALGVPADCYDAIVTSGAAARDDLAQRASHGRLALYHLGPQRDRGVFDGLDIATVDSDKARVVLCTGLFDDETETPDDYAELLDEFRRRGLVFLCANPDLVVQRGGKLVWCAGAIARAYEKMGGEVVYYGKPHPPIYATVLAEARRIAGRAVTRPLAIGDGLETDIRGAENAGLDALFIADGIHGEEIGDFSPDSLARLFAAAAANPTAAMRALVW